MKKSLRQDQCQGDRGTVMARRINHRHMNAGASLLHTLTALVLVLSATSCSSKDDEPDPYPSKVEQRLLLKLVMSRAGNTSENTPTQGAFDRENAIHNITVFFYNHDNGLNGSSETGFFHAVHINAGFTIKDNNVIADVPLSTEYTHTEGNRIAVVVNMGDCSGLSTLGKLQSHVPSSTWTSGGTPKLSECTKFTMASAFDNDGIIEEPVSTASETTTDEEGKTIIYTATATIERTAARIDLEYDNTAVKDGEDSKPAYIEYPVTKAGGETTANGTVHLYGLSPINVMQLPSYSIKHVSVGSSDDFSCFDSFHYTGHLIDEGNMQPSRYVIEPRTATKTSTADVRSDWYGSTEAATLNETEWGADLNIATLLGDEPTKTTYNCDGKKGVVVAYANENTHHHTVNSEKWLTGVLLRAVFVPTTVYSYSDAQLTEDATYTAGTTFWYYRPSVGDSAPLFFNNEDAAQSYKDANPDHQATITKYENGRCFYHAWVRHTPSASGSDTPVINHNSFPMEYGIVRNHIYRLSFTFTRIGDPNPNIDGPENTRPVIFVRPWNVITHETIII